MNPEPDTELDAACERVEAQWPRLLAALACTGTPVLVDRWGVRFRSGFVLFYSECDGAPFFGVIAPGSAGTILPLDAGAA